MRRVEIVDCGANGEVWRYGWWSFRTVRHQLRGVEKKMTITYETALALRPWVLDKKMKFLFVNEKLLAFKISGQQ